MRERARRIALLVVSVLIGLAGVSPAGAQATVGLMLHDQASYDGYTLLAPIPSLNTYLIDNEGKLVHSWVSTFRPGLSVYLTETGNLLRTAQYAPGGSSKFTAGGQGGRVEEYTWDGTLIWDFIYSDNQHRQHHDIERLPNGNVLLIAWEYKSQTEAIAAGRDPARLNDGELWPDHIVEVEPEGPTGGNIVWEWHVWDHLVQEYDPTKDNYGIVADHPELVDLNYHVATGPNAGRADWNHTNGVTTTRPSTRSSSASGGSARSGSSTTPPRSRRRRGTRAAIPDGAVTCSTDGAIRRPTTGAPWPIECCSASTMRAGSRPDPPARATS